MEQAQDKIELSKSEIDNISIRASRIQVLQVDLSIHQKSLNDYVMDIIKKYGVDTTWKISGNHLVRGS